MQIWPLFARAFDGVRRQARAVVHIEHVHLLERQDVGGVHQFGIDGDAALVVQVRLRHARAMDLALETVRMCHLRAHRRARKNPFGSHRRGTWRHALSRRLCRLGPNRIQAAWCSLLTFAHRPPMRVDGDRNIDRVREDVNVLVNGATDRGADRLVDAGVASIAHGASRIERSDHICDREG